MIVRNYSFHRVSPEKDYLWQPMSPVLFEKIIKYLTKTFQIVNLEEYYVSKNRNHKKPLACIVFDDGYKDNIKFALPILRKYNCPASFYIVTDCINNNIPTWTYVFDYLFQHTGILSLKIDTSNLPQGLNVLKWKSRKERLIYAKKFKPFLKRLKHRTREKILNDILVNFNDVAIPKVMMSWDQLRELNKLGFRIGSHSKSHTLLATIEDKQYLRMELKDSAENIREEIGEYPTTISYPFGSYNSKVLEEARSCGYKLGLAVNQRFYNSQADSLFTIPRVELYNENWFKTKLRITGRLERIKKVIRR